MPGSDGGECYQVRGISKELQKRIKEAARAQKTTIGAVVTRALENHLTAEGGAAPRPRPKPLDAMGRLEAITKDLTDATSQVKALGQLLERRLDRLDRQTTRPEDTGGLPLFDSDPKARRGSGT